MLARAGADYDVKSAFQAVYLAVFIAAVVSVCTSIINTPMAALYPFEELFASIQSENSQDVFLLRIALIDAPKWVFAFVVSAHFIRIYLTIEMLEDEEGLFPRYYESFGGVGRAFEFIARLLIVAIVSLKVFPIESLNDLSSFLVIFYAATLAWSTVAIHLGKKKRTDSFLISSLVGFLFSIALYFTDRMVAINDAPWLASIIVLWGANIALGIIVVHFWFHKIVPLFRWYLGKLCSW